MNVKEIENEITEEKKKLGKLEEAYEKEADETKIRKMERKLFNKEDTINKLIERQQTLLDKEDKEAVEDKADKKDKNAEEEDEDVCSECGGDLVFVEMTDEGGIFECEACHELYIDN